MPRLLFDSCAFTQWTAEEIFVLRRIQFRMWLFILKPTEAHSGCWIWSWIMQFEAKLGHFVELWADIKCFFFSLRIEFINPRRTKPSLVHETSNMWSLFHFCLQRLWNQWCWNSCRHANTARLNWNGVVVVELTDSDKTSYLHLWETTKLVLCCFYFAIAMMVQVIHHQSTNIVLGINGKMSPWLWCDIFYLL